MSKKFNGVFYEGERLDGFQIIDTNWGTYDFCKRCGNSFVKKYKKQIFCSRECVSKYKIRINEMKEKYGGAFESWLDDSIDYTYSPDKF